ncbi:MAG: hypothetical protein LBQ60_12130 [Bacteroidales bacterium]|jgi:hypothetical protein|nr:hypothetical protein [Bacteroidales bacterium]
MNRRILFFLWLVFAFFSNCDDSKKSADEEEMLELNAGTLDFNAKESYGFIGITSNTQWTATCDAAWLTPVPASGENHASLRVSAEANTMSSIRTGSVTVTSTGGITRTVEVTQTGTDPYIMVDPVSAIASPAGDEISIRVIASAQWTARVPDDAKEWLSVDPQTTGTLLLSITANESEQGRSAVVTLTLNDAPSVSASVNLSQKSISEGNIDVDAGKITFDAVAGDRTISVSATGEYDVVIPAEANWLKVKDKNISSLTLTAEKLHPNTTERSVDITLQLVSDVTKRISVTVEQKQQIPITNGLGTGWVLYSPTKKIHLSQSLENPETKLYTYAWVPYLEQIDRIPTPVAHYKFTAATNEEEFYFYRTGTNRSEIRLENNYTSGTRQFEGYVTFDLNTNDESIMQVFGSNEAGNATLLMLRAFSANGGEIRVGSSQVIATQARSRWYRVNVIHLQPVSSGNVVTTPGRVIVYIDGEKKFEKADNAIPTSSDPNYFKYGCYGTVNVQTVPAKVLWRNVKVFQNGQPPQ